MKPVLFLLLLFFAVPVLAVEPDEMLADPVLEQQARDIGHALHCPVCQSESVENSPAPMARDLRRLVREQLQAGWTPDQIRQDIVKRYGDRILLKPPFRASTLLLWLGPATILLVAAMGIALWFRRQGKES
ncbi:MAG: cytochrome c-type biogenesis protein CcmH [Pseudomonadota bacterium]|nr:cytochrome c-type biogenesis protein CcmH [Pseudomonadota bacterium]